MLQAEKVRNLVAMTGAACVRDAARDCLLAGWLVCASVAWMVHMECPHYKIYRHPYGTKHIETDVDTGELYGEYLCGTCANCVLH